MNEIVQVALTSKPRRKKAPVHQYVVNCDYSHNERNADYRTCRAVSGNWEPYYGSWDNFCGNIKPAFHGNTCKLVGIFDTDGTAFYQQIPSALLLYRLACTFPAKVQTHGPEGYKCVWEFPLRHVHTGEIVVFGEHKAASSMWTKYAGPQQLPQEFAVDLRLLVQYLCSPTCAHPYDGCVAGAVA